MPRNSDPNRLLIQVKNQIDFYLGELIMSETKVSLVDAQSLVIDIPSISANVTIRTEGNKVFILVFAADRPGGDVVEFHMDMATSGDGTPVTSLD